jgi:hypothetical protein
MVDATEFYAYLPKALKETSKYGRKIHSYFLPVLRLDYKNIHPDGWIFLWLPLIISQAVQKPEGLTIGFHIESVSVDCYNGKKSCTSLKGGTYESAAFSFPKHPDASQRLSWERFYPGQTRSGGSKTGCCHLSHARFPFLLDTRSL